GAVAAEQGDPVAVADVEVDAVEQSHQRAPGRFERGAEEHARPTRDGPLPLQEGRDVEGQLASADPCLHRFRSTAARSVRSGDTAASPAKAPPPSWPGR